MELGKDTFHREASLKADSTLFHFPLQRFDIYVKPTHFSPDLCHLLDRSNSQIEIHQSKWLHKLVPIQNDFIMYNIEFYKRWIFKTVLFYDDTEMLQEMTKFTLHGYFLLKGKK